VCKPLAPLCHSRKKKKKEEMKYLEILAKRREATAGALPVSRPLCSRDCHTDNIQGDSNLPDPNIRTPRHRPLLKALGTQGRVVAS